MDNWLVVLDGAIACQRDNFQIICIRFFAVKFKVGVKISKLYRINRPNGKKIAGFNALGYHKGSKTGYHFFVLIKTQDKLIIVLKNNFHAWSNNQIIPNAANRSCAILVNQLLVFDNPN